MTRRTRRRRTRQEEAEEAEEEKEEKEEEATDIKSNNPHLAGGEFRLDNYKLYVIPWIVIRHPHFVFGGAKAG